MRGDCVVVYSADTCLASRISSVLAQETDSLVVVDTAAGLTGVLESRSVSVAVFALSGHGDSGADVDKGEFARLIDFMGQLRRRQKFGQVLLVAPGKLSLDQSCEAVLAGVTGIVKSSDTDFGRRLHSQFEAAVRYFAEKTARQRRIEEVRGLDCPGLVGVSEALHKVVQQSRRAAAVSDAPVIIYGESGTGKQRIAELIHSWDDKRCEHAFISVNCAAITGSLAESELFGHKKGAFTGATESREGYFRAADGGTILLDEVSELDIALQPKILRLLQEGLVMPVGSDREHRVDVRVIGATNRDLSEMVNSGTFRLDLFQRLNVISLTVPALRQRVEDIPLLFEAFVKKYAHYSRAEITGVDPSVYEIIGRMLGAGNVRELENIVRQVLVFKEMGGRIEIADLPQEMLEAQVRKRVTGNGHADRVKISDEMIEALIGGRKRLAEALDECERVVLARLMKRGLNQTALANRLGVTRRTLYSKLQKYDLR